MIQINLLPVRDIKRRKAAKKQIIKSVGSIVLILGGLLLVDMLQLNSLGKLKEEEQRIVAEKQQYTKILADIKKMEEEKKLLLTRIEVINQLKQSSSLTVHVLDEIANLTPPGRMWLKSLAQTEGQLNLTGMALDEQTVAKYMDDLENSPYVQNVGLTNTAMEIFAERNLKLFSISSQVAMPKKQ
jgi:type IV pilus assembly protein PilN